jgi:hypothetical protein
MHCRNVVLAIRYRREIRLPEIRDSTLLDAGDFLSRSDWAFVREALSVSKVGERAHVLAFAWNGMRHHAVIKRGSVVAADPRLFPAHDNIARLNLRRIGNSNFRRVVSCHGPFYRENSLCWKCSQPLKSRG